MMLRGPGPARYDTLIRRGPISLRVLAWMRQIADFRQEVTAVQHLMIEEDRMDHMPAMDEMVDGWWDAAAQGEIMVLEGHWWPSRHGGIDRDASHSFYRNGL